MAITPHSKTTDINARHFNCDGSEWELNECHYDDMGLFTCSSKVQIACIRANELGEFRILLCNAILKQALN